MLHWGKYLLHPTYPCLLNIPKCLPVSFKKSCYSILCMCFQFPPHDDFSTTCFLKKEEPVSVYELRHGGRDRPVE